jgi:hypothetical protein
MGTVLKASSEAETITGRVRNERVNADESRLKPNLRKRTKSPRPKSPYTIDGIPARTTVAVRIM